MNFDSVRAKLQLHGYPAEKVNKFIEWHRACPDVWRNFERITLELIDMGKKAGAIDILGRVRWECEIIGGKDYKCNNNYAPMLARVFVMKHPRHAEFFEFREAGQERVAA